VVSLDFSVTYSFRPYHGPGVDSAPSENEYQEHFLGVKAASAWVWQPHHLHVPNVMEIWEPKPPGTLWTTPGLLQDSFTFYLFTNQNWYVWHILVNVYNIIFHNSEKSSQPLWGLQLPLLKLLTYMMDLAKLQKDSRNQWYAKRVVKLCDIYY